ncbi:MFS transporter [Salinisphaera japonica]|uniref:MFS transporter n=1 Tax=Salinisphaera japonica YTM-1 TaxID=1209778 RepID=A0A423PWM6_9GAMM|nr:MFS transporter [Salinisphaera japonica]ROO30013.1 MFS transporter [Salinisphaera japonica YTM-1]
MNPALRIGATGFGLIAVCYGFARFAFGLFLPQMREDLALSASLAGLISGGAFFAYCVAIIISARVSERIGARAVAVAAGLVATAGMIGIAVAPSPVWLAVFVVLAGTSTGLASPPMADAVAQGVAPERRDSTNTWINAGTSAGVALSGPIALVLGGQWRLVFVLFAGVALVLAVAAFFALPRTSAAQRDKNASAGLPTLSPNLARLIGAAFLMGAASTTIWSFGGEIASTQLGWTTTGIGLLWIAIGAAGITGAAAGALVARFGINTVHRVFLGVLAASLALVGLAFTTPLLTLVGGALFGAAYVMLTGVYLVWGTTTLAQRPATGLMVGFLTIAIGQTLGAPVFGFVMGHVGLAPAVWAFVGVALATGVFGYDTPQASGRARLDTAECRPG